MSDKKPAKYTEEEIKDIIKQDTVTVEQFRRAEKRLQDSTIMTAFIEKALNDAMMPHDSYTVLRIDDYDTWTNRHVSSETLQKISKFGDSLYYEYDIKRKGEGILISSCSKILDSLTEEIEEEIKRVTKQVTGITCDDVESDGDGGHITYFVDSEDIARVVKKKYPQVDISEYWDQNAHPGTWNVGFDRNDLPIVRSK